MVAESNYNHNNDDHNSHSIYYNYGENNDNDNSLLLDNIDNNVENSYTNTCLWRNRNCQNHALAKNHCQANEHNIFDYYYHPHDSSNVFSPIPPQSNLPRI